MARDGVAVSPELAGLVARRADGERFDVVVECARLGVSTTTFYKYLTRFKAAGVDGLFPLSRRPQRSPTRIATAVEDAVVRVRKELLEGGWDAGADSIRFELHDLADAGDDSWPAGASVPSRASINRVLERRGQLIRVPQRRPRRSTRRFRAAHPNGRWQMDGFRYALSDGQVVVVIHVVDDCSSLDIALYAAPSENAADVWAAFTQAAAEYGLPAEVLTDNGTAFSGRRRGWLTALEQNLHTLGVRHLASSIAHPQTCGKCERAHQPVQKWLAVRTYATLVELQDGLNEYRRLHNTKPRTHLGGLSADQRYRLEPSDVPAGASPAALVVGAYKVASNGTIRLADHNVGIGSAHAHTTVTVFRTGMQAAIFGGPTGNQLIAEFEIKNQRGGYQSAKPRAKVSAKS
jgi:transposase InsO family protein